MTKPPLALTSLKKAMTILRPKDKFDFSKLSRRELIQRESVVGRDLFGPLPKGRRREFFNLDPLTWIWHEEWKDEKGIRQEQTVRYEVRSDGIWKTLPGPRYIKVEDQELTNFLTAAQLYHDRVLRDIYGRDPKTKEKLL